MKEDKLFNKIIKKDYNNLLEELLGIKGFEENIKSLLLSMCYKIETSYGDYEKVKKNMLSKDEYMRNIFLLIQRNCDDIEFIKQEDNMQNIERKYIINREEKKIECYPIEMDLLFCLTGLNKKDNIIKVNNTVISKALNIMLNEGNRINFCEPLRDFNGFSWNIVEKDIQNIIFNLIYQDLIIIKGNYFLEEWINNNNYMMDYFKELGDSLAVQYGEVLSKKIIDNIVKLSIYEYFKRNEDCKKELIEEKFKIERQCDIYKDSSKYIEKIGNKKKELEREIKRIDQTVNDRELLNIQYEKINENLPLEKKIFSMRVLRKKMREERENILEKLEEYAALMNPQFFLKTSKQLNKYMEYLKIIETTNIQKDVFSEIIDFQKNMLELFKVKINKSSEKQDILKLIYEFRYFCQIPINKQRKIYQEKKLIKYIEEIQELIINKAIENKVIVKISNIERINFNIIKNIFYSTVISIEDITIKIYREDELWKVQFFDEKIKDMTIDIEDFINKKDIRVRINKNIKLFG